MRRHPILCIGLISYFVYIVACLVSNSFISKEFVDTLILIVNPLFEILVVSFLGMLSTSFTNRVLKGAFAFCYSALVMVQLVQFFYFATSGEYISVLALENINQLYVVLNATNITLIIMVVLLGVSVFRLVFGSFKHLSRILKTSISLGIVFCITLSMVQNGFFVKNRIKYRRYLGKTPIVSLLNNVLSNRKYKVNYVYNISAKPDRSYLNKITVYDEPLRFEKNKIVSSNKPNVILIFTEGTSARLLGCYGSKYYNITPHIDDFAEHAMKVSNYFNHTAATFRGTHGQLASCYPGKGGYDKDAWGGNKDTLRAREYQTLPNILNNLGYETYFFSPHDNEDPYTDLLKMLKFSNVVTSERYKEKFGVETKLFQGGLRDCDMYAALTAFLNKRDSKEPFMIGMYTLGTHAFFDVYPGGKKYKNDSSVLNTLHNVDNEFGKFWKIFKESRYYNNTIVVFTTDHAHYYESPYVKLVEKEKDYKKLFIDKIPLLIYDPTHKLPNEFNANGRTSLSLTPTILHLLGVSKFSNSFTGESIFERKEYSAVSLSAIGYDFFYIYNNTVFSIDELVDHSSLTHDVKKEIANILDFYKLEESNSIFNAKATR